MKTVLIDRDGTLIVDPFDERVDKIEKIKLFPDSIQALKYLADSGFNIVLVTNQAGIAEGRINEAEFEAINDKVVEMLSPSGIKILKTFVCPHKPEDECDCRKPKPTMILRAAKEFNLNLGDTFMIGDRQSDVLASVNAGSKAILVKTANTPVESKEAVYTAPNLLDAVQYAVTQSRQIMKDHITKKIQLMLNRYEKFGLQNSSLYKQLQEGLQDEQWLGDIIDTCIKVRNGEKIFDIVGQLTKDEADNRLMTMFAEFDTAKRLTNWAKNFFGRFADAEYLPRTNKKQPDFKVWQGDKAMPVESKAFKGTAEIETEKFYAKVIKKISSDALPQLKSFYNKTPFERGIVFIWTQQNVEAQAVRNNSYNELRVAIQKEIDTDGLGFDTQVIIMFANPYDLWNFNLYGKKR